MPIRGFISHLDLNVSDVAASVPFYDLVLGHLGFTREMVDDDRGRWRLDYPGGGVLSIEVRAPAEPAPRPDHERYSPGLDHLAFHAASRDDVDALARALHAAGAVVSDPPAEYDYTRGYYAVAFVDPSGIQLEVVHEPTANP